MKLAEKPASVVDSHSSRYFVAWRSSNLPADDASNVIVAYLFLLRMKFTVLMHCSISAGLHIGQTNPVKWGPWPKGYWADRNPYRMKGAQRVNNVVLLQGEGDYMACMEEGCERHIASLSDCLQNRPTASAIDALCELLNLPH